MSNWSSLYKEIADTLGNIEQVKWIDLWHDQVNFLEQEHPFPTPALFLNFRVLEASDAGQRIQTLKTQIEVFVFYETFADTYKGAVNQESALGFLDLLGNVHTKLHATSGTYYNSMRRVGMLPIDTGGAGNLYQVVFECETVDTTAQKEYAGAETIDLGVEGDIPEEGEMTEGSFIIPG